MKKLSSLLLLFTVSVCYLHAQTNSGSSTTSPPGMRTHKIADKKNLKTEGVKNGLGFINGSFELNTGICIVNGDNATITSNVVATTAYGCGNEIDLMNNDCGYGMAKSGQYFLCLSNGSGTCGDACTLELNDNLVEGETYTVCYFDRGYDVNDCCPPGVPLEVGVSTDAASQGTVVYTSPVPTTNVWSHRIVTFVAPNGGKYISLHALDNAGRWTHTDSFSIIKGDIGLKYCPQVTGLTTNNITITSAKINWKQADFAKGYQYEWRIKGTNQWLKGSTDKISKVLAGLNSGTTYEWRVRTVCKLGSDDIVNTSYVYGPEFTTKASINGNLVNDAKAPQTGFSVTLKPNPVKSAATLQVMHATGAVQVRLTDMQGKTLWQSARSLQNIFAIDVSRIGKGTFIVLVKDDREVKTLKLIRE